MTFPLCVHVTQIEFEVCAAHHSKNLETRPHLTSPATLNRQLLLLLEARGVPHTAVTNFIDAGWAQVLNVTTRVDGGLAANCLDLARGCLPSFVRAHPTLLTHTR